MPSPAALPLPAMTVAGGAARAGVAVLMNAGGRHEVAVQARRRQRRAHALIFGDDEIARGEGALKDLRDAGASVAAPPAGGAATWAADLVNA